jgi:hypothetical protein
MPRPNVPERPCAQGRKPPLFSREWNYKGRFGVRKYRSPCVHPNTTGSPQVHRRVTSSVLPAEVQLFPHIRTPRVGGRGQSAQPPLKSTLTSGHTDDVPAFLEANIKDAGLVQWRVNFNDVLARRGLPGVSGAYSRTRVRTVAQKTVYTVLDAIHLTSQVAQFGVHHEASRF